MDSDKGAPTDPGPPPDAGELTGDQPRRGDLRASADRVLPSRSDPVVRQASAFLGGPWGRHALVGRNAFWTPLRVVLAFGIVVLALGWVQKSPCKDARWEHHEQYTHMCYSDIIPLFGTERLDEGAVPYVDHPVEYPVLTGAFMYAATELSSAYQELAGDGTLPTVNDYEAYFETTAFLLACCALLMIWGAFRLSGRRPWDAAMVALAPLLIVHAFTNWDLFAVALATVALVAWNARRHTLAGVLLGLGTAAKLYPALFLGPLLLLAWRTRQWRPFGRTTVAAAATWLVVNLPVALAYPDSWSRFFDLNSGRPADPDSLWHVLEYVTGGSLDDPTAFGDRPWALNLLSLGAMLVLFGGIAALTLMAPRRPRLPQVLFLVVAGFLLLNKVWSPQYSLWLIPLAVLARPRWRMFLAWQATEVLLWFPRMYWYLDRNGGSGVDEQWFLLAVVIRDVAVLVYCALVVRDILRPDLDVVREDGADDPAGGVFDEAVDDVRLSRPAKARSPVG